jgi:hypothetical protein
LPQDSVDEILRRTVLVEAVLHVADPAADADVRETDFFHVVAHGSRHPLKRCQIKSLFITQAQDRDTIAEAFIHQVFGAVARWMRAVDIAGLVMGAFVPVNEALKFWRR